MTDVKYCDISTVKKLFKCIFDIRNGTIVFDDFDDSRTNRFYKHRSCIVYFTSRKQIYYFLAFDVTSMNSIKLYSNSVIGSSVRIPAEMILDIVDNDLDETQIILSYGRLKLPYEFWFDIPGIENVDEFLVKIQNQGKEND